MIVLCAAAPVLAKGGPDWKQQGQAPPGQQKKAAGAAAKHQAQAQRKAQHQAAKQQRQAAKQQRQAARQQLKSAASARRIAAPSPASATAQAVGSPRRTSTAATRRAAQRRRALHRRALRRRAARLRAVRPSTVAAVPAPVAPAAPILATRTAPRPAKVVPRKAPAPAPAKPATHDRDAVTVVTHTVRDIAHVIPSWAKALLGALAALLLVAALIILAGALRNRRLRALSRRLADEVGVLSTALLPTIPEHVGALGVSVAYRPAQGLAAGGDFYDVFPLDRGRVGIVVGDVSGHGRESLGPANFIRHMVRSYLEAGLAPRAALQLAGKVVDDHNREDFATVIAAVHDPSAGTLSYATAGHPPPVITGPGGHRPLTVASSPPIGVGSLTGLRQTTIPVAPGSTICLFTDGLIEARREGALLGMPSVERMIRELPADATAEQLVARVGREADSLADDIAVCMIRVEGGAQTSSTLRVEEIEVTRKEIGGERLRRFLEACGIARDEVSRVIATARPRAIKDGSVVLRVRLADGRSGVDVLPVKSVAPGAELAALRKTS